MRDIYQKFVRVIWPDRLSCLSSSVVEHSSREQNIMDSNPAWGSSFSEEIFLWQVVLCSFKFERCLKDLLQYYMSSIRTPLK